MIDAPKEIDEYFDLRAISEAPKDFDDLCYYGAALFRHPSVAKDSDYDARGGEGPMKPNLWAQMTIACYLGEADGGNFGNSSSFYKRYDTTLDPDLILSYYRSFFDNAGYTPLKPLPDSPTHGDIIEWTGFVGYTVSLMILDLESRHPDDSRYKDLLYVELSLEVVR